MWPFKEHADFHFDNEKDIHMSSINYDALGSGRKLDSLIILH